MWAAITSASISRRIRGYIMLMKTPEARPIISCRITVFFRMACTKVLENPAPLADAKKELQEVTGGVYHCPMDGVTFDEN